MPINRFFTEELLEKGKTITLAAQEEKHLKVLRVSFKDEIEIVNGKGELGLGRLTKKFQITIHEVIKEKPTNRQHILAMSLIRKLDLVIEKTVELGVDALYLFPAIESEKKGLSENVKMRLQTIAISAMKQCGRLWLPPIELFSSLQTVPLSATVLFGDPTGEPFRPVSNDSILFIGPEKGFTEQELHYLQNKGKGVRLHPNILRAETAAIAAVCLQA